MVEPHLTEFMKWTNNAHHIVDNSDGHLLAAFTHWTLEMTDGAMCIVDLQGSLQVLEVHGMTHRVFELADPAVHISQRRGKGNLALEMLDFSNNGSLGDDGIQLFARKHRCGKVCKTLGLRSLGSR